jgi:hypothetical protein
MLQAAPQKIDLHGLPAHFAFQRGRLIFLASALSIPGKRLCGVIPQLSSPAMQHIGIDLAGTRHFRY